MLKRKQVLFRPLGLSSISSAVLFAVPIVAGLLFFAAPRFALARGNPPPQAASSTVSVTTVVTVMGTKNAAAPPVAKGDVNVTSGKTRLTVTGWESVKSTKHSQLQLAILIDNGLRSTIVGGQLEDLANFINGLPANASVGVFYGENGSATPAGATPFSTDHQAVAKDLRLPMGQAGGDSPSIYLSLGDLVSHWQAAPGSRREVLLLSSGVDNLDRSSQDPYFDSTLDKVQSAGVVIHTIYDGTNRFGSTFQGDISQGKLVQITSESGGQGFFDGNGTPVSIDPYLSQLRNILANQYLLTFTTELSRHEKGELRDIEIRLEQRDLKVSYPKRVLVPGQ